jgi:hypothetical protein
MMADYSHQIDDLKFAAEVCERHVITEPVNGVQSSYPRWPEAWAACETVWRVYLDMKTMAPDGSDDADRSAVILEASRLKGF